MTVSAPEVGPDERPRGRLTSRRGSSPRASTKRGSAWARLAGNLGSVLVSIVVALVLWEGFIRLYHVDKVIAKDPLDVWRYLFTAHADKVHGFRSAAENRTVLFHNLKTTMRDAALGYVAGILLAMVVASVFVLQRTVEQTFMPVALVLRSVPLVAMAPLITLIFGRDVLAVSVIGGIVCFFPALVNIMFGLRATPRSSLDLMASYGASKLTTLRKVLVPSAMPSIFASLRINVPAAIIGALLAEWLATGKGSGNEMLTVVNTFDYGELWAAVVLVTLVSMVLYSVVSAVEAAVLTRYAPDAAGRKN
ncbi:MAG TPA: ABC transporter permease [Acidimicrobiales bacterium]|nr:ABC transporter permease [Acidimicrobiales bacterium]